MTVERPRAGTAAGRDAQPAGLGWSDEDLARAGLADLRQLYTSPAFRRLEDRKVFAASWTLVASSQQIGTDRYLVVWIAGVPVAVWRDGSGTCRAFHNLCSHRGMPLLEGEGPIGRLVTCPYHQWTFDRDGRLMRIPQPDQFPDIDLSSLGLSSLPVVEWHGMIFVCPSAAPPDFEKEVALLRDRLANHLALPLVEVARAEYTVECNWKLLVENHVDVYHLWYLHQRSLADYQHRLFDWQWQGLAWWSMEPPKDPAVTGVGLEGLTAAEGIGLGAHLLFPNLMIVTTGSYLATYDARPLGPARTALTLRVRSTPDADPGRLVESIRAFLAEDVQVCEALQAATGSPFFQIGPTAVRHEEPVRIFHSLLRAKVLA